MISISDMKQLEGECVTRSILTIVMWPENQSQVKSVSSVEHDSLHVPDNRKTRYSTLLDTGELAVCDHCDHQGSVTSDQAPHHSQTLIRAGISDSHNPSFSLSTIHCCNTNRLARL